MASSVPILIATAAATLLALAAQLWVNSRRPSPIAVPVNADDEEALARA